MRIALILLSIVALMFIGSISWSLMNSSVNWTENKKTNEGSMGTDIEELRYKIKTEEKLKELETKYEELARKNGIETKNSSNDSTESGNTVNQQEVPLSGKFLSQVMPTASLTLIENNGIF